MFNLVENLEGGVTFVARMNLTHPHPVPHISVQFFLIDILYNKVDASVSDDVTPVTYNE